MEKVSGFCVFLLLLLHYSYQASAVRIEARCSACRAVTGEIQKRMNKEGVKSDVDLRSKLDSQGKRHGKVIKYRYSELRAAELLDNVCSLMSKYAIGSQKNKKTGKDERAWMVFQGEETVVIDGSVSLGGGEQQEKTKYLELYCGEVMEEHEDDFESILRSDRPETEGLEKAVCVDLLKDCTEDEVDLPDAAKDEL